MRLTNSRICVLSDLLKLSRLAPCPPKIGDPDQLDKLLMLMLMSMLMLTIWCSPRWVVNVDVHLTTLREKLHFKKFAKKHPDLQQLDLKAKFYFQLLWMVSDFSGISCSSESQNMKNAWGPNNKKICLKRSRAQLSIEKESWKGKLGNNMSKDRPYKGLQR